jgi:MFS-type transporter involved in bile tolerance (Atg22 family)
VWFLKKLIQVLRTVLLCGVCYGLGHLTVMWLWPVLGPMTDAWNPKFPVILSSVTAGFLLFVITHMERGQLDPFGYSFLGLYALVCLMFGLSTLPKSQYNTGTAAMEMAFVYMCAWKMFVKYMKSWLQSVARSVGYGF